MSDLPIVWVAVAGPLHLNDRARLQKEVGSLPDIVADSVVMPCCRCDMPLAVGPRTAEKVNEGIALLCPWCVAVYTKDTGVAGIQHLDNSKETDG